MIERIKNIFIAETTKDLTVIQDGMKLIENDILSDELVEKVFRTMHTIKGSAPMFGFPLLSEIAIPVAKAYEDLYRSKGKQGTELYEKTADVIKILQTALKNTSDPLPIEEDKVKSLLNFFNEICNNNQ